MQLLFGIKNSFYYIFYCILAILICLVFGVVCVLFFHGCTAPVALFVLSIRTILHQYIIIVDDSQTSDEQGNQQRDPDVDNRLLYSLLNLWNRYIFLKNLIFIYYCCTYALQSWTAFAWAWK